MRRFTMLIELVLLAVPQAPPAWDDGPVVTETREVIRVYPRATPSLRGAIAGYRAAGGQRWIVHGEDLRSHLMREHRYAADQLAGLTAEELELLHGWVHTYGQQARQTHGAPASVFRVVEPVRVLNRPYFAPAIRGGC